MQVFFNDHVFKMEQEECTAEGVDLSGIVFTSNKPILDIALEVGAVYVNLS